MCDIAKCWWKWFLERKNVSKIGKDHSNAKLCDTKLFQLHTNLMYKYLPKYQLFYFILKKTY